VGLILDSSVVIAAERRGETVERLLQRVVDATGDQDAALSAIGVAELVHGIYRAQTAERRARPEAFIEELLSAVTFIR
jgi:predicted nucleic acid-binding protein